MFPSFKLPQLLRKSSPRSEICEDVPRLKCSELPVKQGIGQGFFGDVNTSEYKDSTKVQKTPNVKLWSSRKCCKSLIKRKEAFLSKVNSLATWIIQILFKHTSRRLVGVCSDPNDFKLFTNALNLEFVWLLIDVSCYTRVLWQRDSI